MQKNWLDYGDDATWFERRSALSAGITALNDEEFEWIRVNLNGDRSRSALNLRRSYSSTRVRLLPLLRQSDPGSGPARRREQPLNSVQAALSEDSAVSQWASTTLRYNFSCWWLAEFFLPLETLDFSIISDGISPGSELHDEFRKNSRRWKWMLHVSERRREYDILRYLIVDKFW